MAMATSDLDTLNEQQLCDLAHQLRARVEEKLTQNARRERLINLKDLKAVVYDLVVDNYVGCKKTLSLDGVTEIGCMAHARRKFFDLHAANQSQLAAQALDYIGELYAIERDAKTLPITERWRLRQEKAKPIADKLHAWMLAQRSCVPDGWGTAKALDYRLKRWVALTRYLDDGAVPIDNNHIEQQIRPIAIGRKNWLFAGSERAGRRAAVVMSLIQTAKLKDVLTRLPTHPNSRIEELLPHNWQCATT